MKKGFSIPTDIGVDISNTIEIAKNNMGSLNYHIVPIDAIEFDPENPRDLHISREDVTVGLMPDDPLYTLKNEELATLQEMAETIKKYGVRNAIEIYKYGNKYRLIHGERRCLSSILAGKKEIPAKVLSEKPGLLDIRVLQLIENVQREDLSLADFIQNVRLVIAEYQKTLGYKQEVNAVFLEKLINKSRAQCFNVLSVLNAPEEVQQAIAEGEIKSLEKAAVIAIEKNPEHRERIFKACLEGLSLSKLKELKRELKTKSRSDQISVTKSFEKTKAGRKAAKISLGSTCNKAIVERFISLVMADKYYQDCRGALQSLENTLSGKASKDYDAHSRAFKKLLILMEKIEAEK